MPNEDQTQKTSESKEQKKGDFSDELQKLKEELVRVEEEKNRYINDWKKARAELINYKKEEEERLRGVMQFANERLVKELIGILDSFDLALQSLESSTDKNDPIKDNYLKGIYLIKNQLEDLLKREGLEEILVEKGQSPNLLFQEIVAEIDNPKLAAGTVAEIFQKGYLLNGKIIRPARVAVVKKKDKDNELKN